MRYKLLKFLPKLYFPNCSTLIQGYQAHLQPLGTFLYLGLAALGTFLYLGLVALGTFLYLWQLWVHFCTQDWQPFVHFVPKVASPQYTSAAITVTRTKTHEIIDLCNN